MSAFPSIPWSLDSKEDWVDDVQLERASNGDLRARAFYDTKKKAFDLSIKAMSAAQKTALEAHYDAHRTTEFDFTWRDGVTYVVAYGKDAVKPDPLPGGNWSASVRLEQV